MLFSISLTDSFVYLQTGFYSLPSGVFLFLGYSRADEKAIYQFTNTNASKFLLQGLQKLVYGSASENSAVNTTHTPSLSLFCSICTSLKKKTITTKNIFFNFFLYYFITLLLLLLTSIGERVSHFSAR